MFLQLEEASEPLGKLNKPFKYLLCLKHDWLNWAVLAGWCWSAQSVQQHAAEDPRQQVQLRQLPLLGQLRNASHSPPPPKGCVCVRASLCKAKQKNSKQKDTLPSQWATLGSLALLPPPPQVLISLLGSLFPPPFSKLVVHVRYLCMYLYIYTVYVIVEHEMWLLHFIFEGLLFTFFKTAGNDVTLRQNEMMIMMVTSEWKRWSKTSCKKPEKGNGESYSTDCIWGHFRWGWGL